MRIKYIIITVLVVLLGSFVTVFGQANASSKPNPTGLAGALPPVAFPGGEISNEEFRMSIPILNFKGRGLDLDLKLRYKSNLWYQGVCEATNPDRSPADFSCPRFLGNTITPGFTFDFGTVENNKVRLPSDEILYFGEFTNFPNVPTLCEGTQYDHTCYGADNGGKLRTTLTGTIYTDPSGTKYTYGVGGLNKIEDQNGNYIQINYTQIPYPGTPYPITVISSIVDTLGKEYNFYYSANAELVSVTAPQFGGGVRQVARFYYESQIPSVGQHQNNINYQPYRLLKYVYFPSDSSAMKFDYTNYSVVKRVENLKGVTVSTNELNTIGQINSTGTVGAWTEYNYPIVFPSNILTPYFTTRTDDWVGRDIATQGLPSPVHNYSSDGFYGNGNQTVVAPDGTQTTTFRLGTFDTTANGYPYEADEYNLFALIDHWNISRIKAIEVKKNGNLLSKTVYKWSMQTFLIYSANSSQYQNI
jgi:hypothetical protein